MQRRYLLVLMLLVLIPLLAFFTLGRRLVDEEQARTRRQFAELLRNNLSEVDRSLAAYFSQLEQQLLRDDLSLLSAEQLRQRLRTEPRFEQIVRLAHDGSLVYPDPAEPMTAAERGYLLKIESLITDRALLRRSRERSGTDGNYRAAQTPTQQVNLNVALGKSKRFLQANAPAVKGKAAGEAPQRDYGWYTWYWGNGLQLIHWRSLPDGGVLAIGLLRARWMAELIGTLPDSSSETVQGTAQIRLVNAEGSPLYVWGSRQPREGEPPVVSLHLSAPLRAWQLEHFGPSQPLDTGRSATLLNLIGSGGLLFAGLAALAYYLFHEVGRATRDARQRVNFVNQVSHELKTPLTNIRMYADLLERDLERLDVEDDERTATHLAVITGESSRLSRLINNVLTFARSHRAGTPNRLEKSSIDTVIHQVVEQFRPSLAQLDIALELSLDASPPLLVDVDALEQILGNLISNVEKYASGGKFLAIRSALREDRVEIEVADAGPGIGANFVKRVFEPFERASDQIEAATGTGIGLPIARELARRCGGDLVLLESEHGAAFRVTLPAVLAEDSS